MIKVVPNTAGEVERKVCPNCNLPVVYSKNEKSMEHFKITCYAHKSKPSQGRRPKNNFSIQMIFLSKKNLEFFVEMNLFQ